MQQYITLKQLQEKLHIGKNTALELVNLKSFPAIKIGKVWRIGEVDLEKWLHEQIK